MAKAKIEPVEETPVEKIGGKLLKRMGDHYCRSDKSEAIQLAAELEWKLWHYSYKKQGGGKHNGYVIAKTLAVAKKYFSAATLKEVK